MALDKDAIWERLAILLHLAQATQSSGRSANETLRIIRLCAKGIGLDGVEVMNAGNMIHVQYVLPSGETLSRGGAVSSLNAINCDRMKRLEMVAHDIAKGTVDLASARKAIEASDAVTLPFWWSLVGVAILGLSVALQVGGAFRTAIVAAVLHFLVTLSGNLAGRWNIPHPFLTALQCLVGGALALVAHDSGILTAAEAAVALAVSWMLLVPLPPIIAAVMEAVGTLYAAAVARIAALGMAVGGIILGGLIVIVFGRTLPMVPPDQSTLPVLAVPLAIGFSVLGAMANAMANSGGRDLLLPAAFIGLFTACCNQGLMHLAGVPSQWSAPIAAVALGFCARMMARRLSYPAPALALMGLTGALLPGLVVYQGLATEMTHASGARYFLQAAITCAGLGVATTLGFLLASYVEYGRKKAQNELA